MSVALRVTRGFGNSSIVGSVADIVTRGYTIGDEASIWTEIAYNAGNWTEESDNSNIWTDVSDNTNVWT